MASAHLNFPENINADDRDLIREFALSADVGAPTRVKYVTHLVAYSTWLADHGSSKVLLGAAAQDAHRFLASLRDPDRPGGELSPSTRKNYLGSLRSFYRYCLAV